MTDLGDMMRQAQEMRSRLQRLQEELGAMTVEGSSGGGMVVVTANGRQEVVSVRIPCSVFKNWLGLHGCDAARWQKRFTAAGRPGPYLRVLEPGALAAGDEIVVEHRPDHDVTVSTMFQALTTERHLLPRLVGLDRIDPEATEAAERYVATLV